MAMYFAGASPSLSLTLQTDPFCGFSAFPDDQPIEGLQRYCSSEFTGKNSSESIESNSITVQVSSWGEFWPVVHRFKISEGC